MTQRRRRRPSFHAQPAFVDGKSLVAGDLDAIAVADEIHAALQRAVRTMSRRQPWRRGFIPARDKSKDHAPHIAHGA